MEPERLPTETPPPGFWQPGAFLWIFALLVAGVATVFVPFVALVIVPVLLIGFALGMWNTPRPGGV
ncbi:MAG: hypothetical protein JST04_13725 [Bdellovibrionales bacterium]|nr:hypothetical protein [Bdellovibrionales bacterium]